VPFKFAPSQQPFNDPAIMSASFASPVPGTVYASQVGQAQLSYGPPPGLSYPQDVSQSPAVSSTRGHETAKNVVGNGSTHGESLPFTSEGREVSTECRAFSVRKIYRP